MLNWISRVWCKMMHRKAMWPIHGRYLCPKCLQVHQVKWEEPFVFVPQPQPVSRGEMSIPSTVPVIQ